MYSTDNGTVFKIKGRHRRSLMLMAEESEFPNYRHGALLVRGSSILNSAFNKVTISTGQTSSVPKTAVMRPITRNLVLFLEWQRKTTGATIYVARIASMES